MSNQKNIGVVGVGRWGPNVIGSLLRINGVNVKVASDTNQASLNTLKSRFKDIATTTNVEDLFIRDDIDAIAICTPVDTHLGLVAKALEGNKHVFVEKPFGRDHEECFNLCKLAEKKGLEIVIGFVFLFNAYILRLKEIIDSGELGTIQHLEAHRTNLGPVRKDVNAVWDLSSHDLSIFDYLLDSIPEAVNCIGSCKLDPRIEDTTYTTFRYPNNILAHAHASWLNPVKIRKLTVIGSKKMALCDDLNLEHPITIYDSSIGMDQQYYSDSFASHRLSYKRGDVLLPSISTNEPLLDEMKHFIDVIRGEVKNRSSGIYGSKQSKVLSIAENSLKMNGAFLTV